MKWLHCKACGDIRRIYGYVKFAGQNSRCTCAKVVARYIDNDTVVWNGVGAILGAEIGRLSAAERKARSNPTLATLIPMPDVVKVLPRKWAYLKIQTTLA